MDYRNSHKELLASGLKKNFYMPCALLVFIDCPNATLISMEEKKRRKKYEII